eukprot:29457-Pelagococcus_subviridis.AAC.4
MFCGYARVDSIARARRRRRAGKDEAPRGGATRPDPSQRKELTRPLCSRASIRWNRRNPGAEERRTTTTYTRPKVRILQIYT